MSSSEEDSKIDLLDSEKTLIAKMKKAFCEPGNIKENGVLSFLKYVIFPLFEPGRGLEIKRKEENGGDVEYTTYEEVEEAFANQSLHPGDLKDAVRHHLNRLLEPIRVKFSSPELQALTKKAYPAKPKEGAVEDVVAPHRLDIRIGKIVDVCKHPEADHLYIEKIDLGEGAPRTIVSGLAAFVELEQMKDRMVVVLCNLKPAKMRGVESAGMVLCASVYVFSYFILLRNVGQDLLISDVFLTGRIRSRSNRLIRRPEASRETGFLSRATRLASRTTFSIQRRRYGRSCRRT